MERIDISGLQEALFTAIVKFKSAEMPLVYSEVCDTKWIKDVVDQLVTIEFRYIEHLIRNMEAADVECKGLGLAIGLQSRWYPGVLLRSHTKHTVRKRSRLCPGCMPC